MTDLTTRANAIAEALDQRAAILSAASAWGTDEDAMLMQQAADMLRDLAFLHIGQKIGRKSQRGRRVHGRRDATILRAKSLIPFITSDLLRSTEPIIFETRRGITAFGYRATLLPSVCLVYHDARLAGKLLPGQEHIAKACEALQLSFLDRLTLPPPRK